MFSRIIINFIVVAPRPPYGNYYLKARLYRSGAMPTVQEGLAEG